MVSSDKLTAFLNLQQFALDIEENGNILDQILPKSLAELESVGISYQFVGAIFFDNELKFKHSYFFDKNSYQSSLQNVIHLEVVFNRQSSWEKDLLWGSTVVLPSSKGLIFDNYPEFPKIKSVIISPIKVGKKVTGVLIYGTFAETSSVSQEDKELIELITHFSSFVFRLQDTQSSLTKITQQVYEVNAQLHQLDKLKDDFVSVASHELRTPMTAIRSYAWMALYRPDVPLPDKIKRYLSRVLISTERLINLVNDLLNISRIESGRVEILPQAFDIVALSQDVLIEVDQKAKEKNLRLGVVNPIMPKIFADPDKVHQVLLNLVGNALKFTPVDSQVEISFFTDGKMVETSVKDSGVGISKDDLSRLFKKFGRLDNTYVAAATSGGTGLGLYISKSLIDLMGGKIWASSEGPGRGAVFTFSLPVATTQTLSQADKYTRKSDGEAKPLEPVAI